MKKTILFILFMVASVMLFACTDEPAETPIPTILQTYAITFNSDGGNTISNQSVQENGLISEPVDPSKEGYVFVKVFSNK